MNFRRTVLLILMLMLNFGLAWGGDLEDGAAALEKQDYATARKLIPPLARQGSRDGQRIMGFMYMYEAGMPRDYSRAYLWWSAAAAQGDSKSGEYRDTVTKLLTPEQLAEAKKKISECSKRKFKACD